MSARIIPFPVRHREPRVPSDAVRIVQGDPIWSEWWVVAGSNGWLHGSLTAAFDDAAELAGDLGGVPISLTLREPQQ